MTNYTISERAILLAQLAEEQDAADEAVTEQLKVVLDAQRQLRADIEFRDALRKVRNYLGIRKC